MKKNDLYDKHFQKKNPVSYAKIALFDKEIEIMTEQRERPVAF